MSFRAFATDYDGTLTDEPRPSPEVLDALRETRQSGRKVLLVTGRILSELRAVFPDVEAYFDAIVAENGAVLWLPEVGSRPLVPPISRALEQALAQRGVPLQRGEVLLATEAFHDAACVAEIGRLGLDCQLVRNRGALMILPAGISKGSGLLEGLAELGISHHSCVAIGDAENDHSLIDVAEVGVAVGNAVGALKAHADVVLGERSGAGVVRFLRGPVWNGQIRVEPKRWRIRLGTSPEGVPVTVPGSGVNLLVSGQSGSGKSYLTGLFGEGLAAHGYTFCLFDLEGDHVALGELRGVLVVGGRHPPPSPEELERLLTHRFLSLVIDLSCQEEQSKRAYTAQALAALAALRRRTGLPHWIVLEEAHVSMGLDVAPCLDLEQRGVCLVTYQPEQLARSAASSGDIVIRIDEDGRGWLFRTERAEPQRFETGARATPHVRHLHKYQSRKVPRHRRFLLRDEKGPLGREAGNLAELAWELRRADLTTLRHHAPAGDFSRWIAQVIRDERLARAVGEIEEQMARADAAQHDRLREDLVTLLEARGGVTRPDVDGAARDP